MVIEYCHFVDTFNHYSHGVSFGVSLQSEKSIISWEINIFPDFLNHIQDRNLNILGKLSN